MSSTVAKMYYTIEQINTFSGVEFTLPEETLHAIKHLDQLQAPIQVRTNTQQNNKFKGGTTGNQQSKFKTHPNTVQSTTQQFGGLNHKKHSSSTTPTTDSEKQWSKIEKLKATVIEKKEGIEKIKNDIRSVLNKMSDKNYEQQYELIIGFLEPVETIDDDIEIKQAIAFVLINTIFDIIMQNEGLFKNQNLLDLYIDLLGRLNLRYTDIFVKFIHDFFTNFKHTIEDIVYYDSETHYDEYCKYTKFNNIRKSNTTIIVHLFNRSIITIEQLCDILNYFQNKFDDYLMVDNKQNELEQIAENIFILITLSYQQLKTHPLWVNDLKTKIEIISKEKAKVNFPSLTNKVIFKYKDLMDFIKKM